MKKLFRLLVLTWFLTSAFLLYQLPNFKTNLSRFLSLRHRADNLSASLIYPTVKRYSDDRIEQQLRFVPESVRRRRDGGEAVPVKTILLLDGASSWGVRVGPSVFEKDNCAVSACKLIDDQSQGPKADVVLTKRTTTSTFPRLRSQVWAIFELESPNNADVDSTPFNWTATYRHDSTIVAPYEKFISNASVQTRTPVKNFAHGKTKKVAWFASNCQTSNQRLWYAKELAKFIQVDIYGLCGTLECPRWHQERCFAMLNRDYKFYLAFENSNCRDYITEKFFITGLKHDVIPVAMGAPKEDYLRAAPPHSFIHVDDFRSPRELATYLHQLDQNDVLFNQYFAWKGLWDNINTFFWCRICALAHDVDRRGPSWFENTQDWWSGANVCIKGGNWNDVIRPQLIAGLAAEASSP